MTPEILPVIGVMGSGRSYDPIRADQLGSWLATIGVHLLTGGGGGTMARVSRSFANTPNRKGKVIGLLPGIRCESSQQISAPVGYPNQWVEIVIQTHLPYSGNLGTGDQSRNHINVLSSDVIIVLPGQAGTASETKLAVQYTKPIAAWLYEKSELICMHPEVPIFKEFAQIQEFVAQNLPITHDG